jgi:thiol:disulfide interchange protein DsbC
MRRLAALTLLFAALSLTACDRATSPDHNDPASASVADQAKIRSAVAGLVPAGTAIDNIRPAPLPGLTEVTVGGRIAYVTNDGKHLVQGPIVELASRRNLTQLAEAGIHKKALEAVGEDRRIVFPATTAEKYRITVFTDVECAYCREFHKHIADYNKAGITVEYLMYPRGGVETPAAREMANVWCAKDRRQALTDAKNGIAPPEARCENHVADDYSLGQSVGVMGTPAIFAANGMQIGGFIPPHQIAAALDQALAQATN